MTQALGCQAAGSAAACDYAGGHSCVSCTLQNFWEILPYGQSQST